MILDWFTATETLARREWMRLFVIGEIVASPIVRRLWQWRFERWLEAHIRIGKPAPSERDRAEIINRECDRIEWAARKYDGSEQRRAIAEHVAAIRTAAGHGG